MRDLENDPSTSKIGAWDRMPPVEGSSKKSLDGGYTC
jgi:hypothetical protein